MYMNDIDIYIQDAQYINKRKENIHDLSLQ